MLNPLALDLADLLIRERLDRAASDAVADETARGRRAVLPALAALAALAPRFARERWKGRLLAWNSR